VHRDAASEVAGRGRFFVVCDATRWNKVRLLRMACKLFWIMLRVKPDVVITTGAAPGYFAIRFGKWLGARTIWLDSVANVERLSMSGEKAGAHVDLWLTQWSALAQEGGPIFAGSVL